MKIGRDGRKLRTKAFTGACRRCTEEFTSTMTTRRPRYCAECVVIIEIERRRVNNRNTRLRRKEQRDNPPPELPRPPIRYAGYDESERPLSWRNEDV